MQLNRILIIVGVLALFVLSIGRLVVSKNAQNATPVSSAPFLVYSGVTKPSGISALQMHVFYPPTATPTSTPIPPTVIPTLVPITGTQALQPIVRGGNASSLLCGTNLGLFNDSDFIGNPTAQTMLSKLHISTLRMPWRSGVDPSGARIVKSVQIAHSQGITPLVILKMGGDATTIAANQAVVKQLNTIMAGSKIFYEFGNEPPGGMVNYTAVWNQGVPPLKAVAQNAWFGGPVWYANTAGSNTPTDLVTFYTAATPKPDFISWHEYTCGSTNTAQECFDHVANVPGHNWGEHMLETKTAFQKANIPLPPVFITEWNYDSAAPGVGTDPRLAILNGMHFVTTSLTELKSIGIYAAYHYVYNTNSGYNLINYNGSLTGEGQDFQAFCQ